MSNIKNGLPIKTEDNGEVKLKSFIEEIEVVNNKTDMRYTYKAKQAPFGLNFGYGKDQPGLLIINRHFSEDGKQFEGVARLTDFSILNIILK